MRNQKFVPTKNYPYFYYDVEDSGFVYFQTEKERDEAVKEAIQDYLDDGWNEEVENIVVGEMTGSSTKINVQIAPDPSELDEEGCDKSGEYWDQDWDYKCDYEIKPLGYVCPTNIKLGVGL